MFEYFSVFWMCHIGQLSGLGTGSRGLFWSAAKPVETYVAALGVESSGVSPSKEGSTPRSE